MVKNLSQTTWHALLVSFLPGMGKSSAWKVISQPEFARAKNVADLADIFPELSAFRRDSSAHESALRKATKQLDLAEKFQVDIIGFWDKSYPRTFRKSHLSPAVFWFKGDMSCLDTPTVAIIGTRQPTTAGEISAARIAEAMATRGLTVVSGLALGIDAIAHKATLAAIGKTIAVLAGGLDRVSPKANMGIAISIAAGSGGLLSEFPLESPTYSSNFVTRDATQAALSAAVILIQSDRNGGSMHASRAILKIKRNLIVTAPVPTDIANQEPKIDANLLFFNNGLENLVSNHGFPADSSALIRKLTGKSDYDPLAEEVKAEWELLQPRPRGV